MNLTYVLMVLGGVLVGVGASFSGLGGGFLIVPLLLILGYPAQKAVGTSFLAILVISLSALFAHNRLANVDYRVGILLGAGGVVGAQIGPRLLEHVSTAGFKRLFAGILVGLAAYLFFQKWSRSARSWIIDNADHRYTFEGWNVTRCTHPPGDQGGRAATG
jgi:uncharacterized membrane protein YfcA